MKILLVTLIFSTLLVFSQNIEEKVKEAIGSEKYNFYLNNYPDSIKFYKFIVENGYRIFSIEHIKSPEINNIQEISIPNNWIINGKIDFKKFNILKLNIKFNPSIKTYYKIENTDYIIELISLDYLRKKYEDKK